MINILFGKDDGFVRGYINNITKFLDENTTLNIKGFNNYIYDEKMANKWIIRYLGATRGHITVDDESIIVDIKLYDTSYIYKDATKDEVKKFIGHKLELIKN